MSESNSTTFNFWWTTSKSGGTIFGWFLAITGVIVFFIGWGDEGRGLSYFNSDDFSFVIESFFKILVFYVAINLVAWYFIVNIGRYVYSCINRTDAVQAMQETRREKTELETLRRRKELKELREEFGDEPAADSGVPDARKVSSEESGNDMG